MATVGDVLRVTLSGATVDGETWNMVFHYAVDAGSDTDYNQIALDLEDAFQLAFANFEPLLSDQVTTEELNLAEWDFVLHEWDGKEVVAANVLEGEVATDAEPGGVALVMRFITDSLRRQARKFVPGLVENQVVGNDITGTTVAAALVAAELLNNAVTGGGLTLKPCVFSDKPLSPHFETFSEFTATALVNTRVGYQRKRQPGDGI